MRAKKSDHLLFGNHFALHTETRTIKAALPTATTKTVNDQTSNSLLIKITA